MVKSRQAKELLSTNAETTVEAILKSGEIVQVTSPPRPSPRSPSTWWRRP